MSNINNVNNKKISFLTNVKNKIKKFIKKIDEESLPRKETAGDFEDASYFQGVVQGATEGWYFMGPTGAAIGAGSAAVGVTLERLEKKFNIPKAVAVALATFIAGSATFVATGGAAAPVVGASLLGAFQTFRGDALAKVRDAAGNATLISAFFMPGASKLAGGVASAIGEHMDKPSKKALVGGVVGATLGAVLAASGLFAVSLPMAVIGSGLAGAVGPLFGPRFSQFFRNLGEDFGKSAEKFLLKHGIIKDKLKAKYRNSIGMVPASFIKEGTRGFINTDFSPIGILVGGISESVQQIQIALFSKHQDEENNNINKDNNIKDKDTKSIKD